MSYKSEKISDTIFFGLGCAALSIFVVLIVAALMHYWKDHKSEDIAYAFIGIVIGIALLAWVILEYIKERSLIEETKAKQATLDTQEAMLRQREAEAKIKDAERVSAEKSCQAAMARQNTAEIERQSKLNSFPVSVYFDAFMKHTNAWFATGDQENMAFELYLKLKTWLQQASKIPLDIREQFSEDMMTINRADTVFKKYQEMINRVKNDQTLDQEAKDKTIKEYEKMREEHIRKIRGS